MRILVVDDNEKNVRLLADVLEARGYAVLTAKSGGEGLERAWKEAPDLVLMDVQMPGMSGTEAMQRLKADPRSAALPVVAVTALAMSGDEAQLLAAGFDGYVSKPLAFKSMLATVERFRDPGRAPGD